MTDRRNKKRLHPIPRVIVIVACQQKGKAIEYLVLRKAGKKGAFQPSAGWLDAKDMEHKDPHRAAALRELGEETKLEGKLTYLGIVDRTPKKGEKYTSYAAKVYLRRLKHKPHIELSNEHRERKWRKRTSTLKMVGHSPRYPRAFALAAKKLTK